MAYKVIILYRLYMPSYFLGTFTEYPFLVDTNEPKYIFNCNRSISSIASEVYLQLHPKYIFNGKLSISSVA